ncbi:chloride channel protein CLC-e isoform X2 [Magnolia sinica]|uniref:chloride channel protein CLC-e isoform X2 n=1 Tax=Magnolia sinica TaxID=86752 RepID=UPI0026591E5D|nr:chloride channel protein CLC-e isoform X2 [Magnolia sinica]
MALACCIWNFPNPISYSLLRLGSSAGNRSPPPHLAKQRSNAARCYDLLRFHCRHGKSNQGVVLPPPASLPEVRGGGEGGVEEEKKDQTGDRRELGKEPRGIAFSTAMIEEAISPDGFMVISACLVGLLTGMGVVLFNNTVHEIRDFFWDGIPARGASWLREEPIEEIWQQVILVPVCGGVMVGMLNSIRSALDTSGGILSSNLKAALKPFLKALAASITLGTGNSLGPEGPSVEIGASIAKGVGNLFERGGERRLSLVAAGSAAGISSGFNAAVAGCFFAVESVLWPSPVDSSSSLANTTSMVILSAVIASVVSEVGLGSDPAFTVPEYDFRSPSELPLYLLLGVLCGLVSLTLSKCTSYAVKAVGNAQKATGMPKAAFPVLGGLAVGLIALAYPEILYWGFENVDILLESRPFVKGLPADLLLQLVGVKILTTSLCRASGLVGGYYAPSLFIGAATGMAYGKFASYAISQSDPIFHLSILEVASPQAYGLVGMAATLAGVCQVPLTSVLLLFELTQDYRIVLPLLGAVGLSSWIASSQTRNKEARDRMSSLEAKTSTIQKPETSSLFSSQISSVSASGAYVNELCELESSLCVDDYRTETKKLEERILVSQAMRTRYVTVLRGTSLTEAVTLMFAEKQSCAVIVDGDNFVIGLVTLGDVQEFSKVARSRSKNPEVRKLMISEMCNLDGEGCREVWTITPSMSLLFAERIMTRYSVNQLPVVSEHVEDRKGGHLVGLLDRECINLACRAIATKEFLSLSSTIERPDS